MSSPRRGLPPLEREAMAADPLDQFRDWFELAEREAPLAEAMTLATIDASGAPNARMVLLKGFGPDGFRFFTNYESAKGKELGANPTAALVIYWRELDRQVRIRGEVRRLADEESDAYFRTRPRDSRIAAVVSVQSRPVEREPLDREFEAALAAESEPARPSHWGGYVLEPREVEFWQGRESRMHDRFRYTRDDASWRIERLAP